MRTILSDSGMYMRVTYHGCIVPMPPHEHIKYLAGSPYRAEILSILCSDRLRPAELTEQVAVTRTTVHRILSGFCDRQWVRKQDGLYYTTVTGKRVLAAYDSITDEVERAEAYGPLVAHCGHILAHFPPELYTETTVTHATDQQPLAPLERYLEMIDTDTSVVQASVPILTQLTNDAILQHAQNGITMDIFIDKDTFETAKQSFSSVLKQWVSEDTFTLYVSANPVNYGISIVDDRMLIGGYTPARQLAILVDGTHPTLVSSAAAFIDSMKDTSLCVDSSDKLAAEGV